MVDAIGEYSQHPTNAVSYDAGLAVAVSSDHDKTSDICGLVSDRDLWSRADDGSAESQKLARYKGTSRVYDIVDAGPEHRFTVSNILVHNCLSLGFGGGVGAFQAMARNYGLRVDDATADQYKVTWRLSNPWAQRFWNALETAAFNAVKNPETIYAAGRVSYFYAQGSLWCLLPSGRTLCYPFAQLELMEDRFGSSLKVTAIKASHHPAADSDQWPRMTLWGGLQAEGATQGEAASLLRYARRESYACDWYQIGDTHDELLWEVDEHEEKQAKVAMLDIMTTAPDWAAGLPLRAEIKSGAVYGT